MLKYDFPGLVKNARDLLSLYNLPNINDNEDLIFSKTKWKALVTKNVHKVSEENIKREFLTYSKLKDPSFQEENLEMKDYVKEMKISDARTMFKKRSSTLPFKMNRKGDKQFSEEMWRCDNCIGLYPETTNHVLWCPSYAPLREGSQYGFRFRCC